MGFFDDLQSPVNDLIGGADTENIGFQNPPAGTYYFVFQGAELKTNTGANKDGTGLVFHFGLEDADGKTHNYSQYMPVPQPADPRNPSDADVRQAAYLKKMLLDLGTPEDQVNSVDSSDLEGATGTLQLTVSTSKGREYTNTRNIKLKEQKAKPVAKAAAQPARKAPAQRRAQPLPTVPVEAPADENEQEYEEPPVVAQPKAKPAQVAGNPFAR